jgi:hypothetical protein
MENKIKQQKSKVSMILSGKSLETASTLGEIIGEESRTRVVSSALEIAKEIMKQVKEGKHLVLKGDDGSEQELKIIIG